MSLEDDDDRDNFVKDDLLSDLEPLEDLDDTEFGLPPVEHPPSLEDILAEDNDVLRMVDDLDEDESTSLAFCEAQAAPAVLTAALHRLGINGSDSTSLHSHVSDARSRTSSARKVDKMRHRHGSILRHVVLKGISSQLVSARDRVDAGLPTAMAASSAASYVAVGTSHGYILLFDGQQKLRFSLGGTALGREHGSVSCLAFDRLDSLNEPPSRLLVGFAKGFLLEFDIVSGKLIRTLDDVHPPGSAVLHVRFTDDHSLALMSNSGGSVFEISFRRTLGIRGYSSRCIFSGSRGEVCTFEPLSALGQQVNHSYVNRSIVALSTISKIIVLTLRPTMKVLFTHSLVGKSDTLPTISWQWVIIQTSSTHRVVDPVLAFGRQSIIHFFQLTENLSGKIVFVPLQVLELSYEMISFGWVSTRCLTILDRDEQVHLYDVKNQENLESLDLSIVQLCYGSSFFKGLSTGGNVSAAMKTAGEAAVYGSVITVANQLLLLGRNSFHVLVIRSWSERLDHLVKNNQYLESLSLGLDFYQDVSRALAGLRGSRDKRRVVIGQKIVSILLKFLDVAMSKNFPEEGDVKTLTDYFGVNVPPCVDVCMLLNRQDLLFEQVWNTFNVDPFGKASFSSALESYILSDQLRTLPVPVTQEFVTYYENSGRLVALEACITHLEVTSVDIHQIMNVCNAHGLYDAIIYIFNNGFLDFVTPVEELMTVLSDALKSQELLTSQQIKLGNKLLVYISCCLAGRSYPYGDIAADKVAQVKYDIYTCLTALHTKRASDSEPIYPYLRTLLMFDTQGLLNVISIAFEEPEFNTELGRCQKQRLVDILLKIIVESNDFSPGQVAFLFTFLARQMAKGDNCLNLSRTLFDDVLSVLTGTTELGHHEEREQALQDMLSAGGMQYFDREHLIACASRAGFHRILEILYELGGEFEKLLRCYIDDPRRRQLCFNFVQKVFVEPDSTGDDIKMSKRSGVEKSVLKDLIPLIEIDGKKTANLIYFHMYPFLPLILSKLEATKKELFAFLKVVLELRETGSQPSSPVKTASRWKDEDILNSADTYEQFIELMCEFEPNRVAAYLRTKTGHYNSAKVLKAVQAAHIVDAEAFLLEEEGRIDEAFGLMCKDLRVKLNHVVSKPQPKTELPWTQLNAAVLLVIQFCQRISSRSVDSRQHEKLWFDLLDVVMAAQREASQSLNLGDQRRQFKDVVRHIVNSAMGCVNLRDLIEKIVQDPVYLCDESFGEIRDFLLEMLEMYHYEETLMISTSRSVRADMHNQLLHHKTLSQHGFSVRQLSCILCHHHLAGHVDSIVFQCGHAYHVSCLERAGCLVIVSSSNSVEESWQCYSCVVSKNAVNRAVDILQASEPSTATTNASMTTTQRDIVDEITNQRVMRAKKYANLYKSPRSFLSVLDLMNRPPHASHEMDFIVTNATSVFEHPDFPLKLAPDPPDH